LVKLRSSSESVSVGQTLLLDVERPAVGGRMIARANGQVVLVDGAIPGERVLARIERVGKGVAYASTVEAEEPSHDRRESADDRLCGGCLYAHIAYERQLALKSLVITDAFARIGRLSVPGPVTVAASPPHGYRMRARLHRRDRRIGFFREGTHALCDVRATGQLLPVTCDVIERLDGILDSVGESVREIELSENVEASQRVVNLDAPVATELDVADRLAATNDVTGMTVSGTTAGAARVLFGSAYVADVLELGDLPPITLRRHVLAFFQGNRFLLRALVAHVCDQVPTGSRVIDLYAGGGLFAIAAERVRGAVVTAVEGDRVSAEDLVANMASARSAITPVYRPVEVFTRTEQPGTDVVLVDPPRTGMSREALRGLVQLGGRRIVYVSCDIATLARDSRLLVDAGYEITRADAFDMFPNTPHVETVAVFDRR
jgi:23S rRNA (uracil1939-C5)-methyltransferase